MKIVIVTYHFCGRVVKQVRMLKKLGYELHLLTNRISKYNLELFDSVIYYKDPKSLKDNLNLFSDNDIYHVHNEPSWMATVIREKYDKARIILYMHDSTYWRVEAMK